jgi:hypothetical protein
VRIIRTDGPCSPAPARGVRFLGCVQYSAPVVAYESREVFPRPIATVWDLLRLHLDDQKVRAIHPLILSQTTRETQGTSVLVERTIDVRGKPVRSVWRITYEPPHRARWDIVESAGPWTQGSWLENTYSEAPGGTTIETRAEMRIVGLPFFLSQRSWVGKVLDKIDSEDVAFLGTA